MNQYLFDVGSIVNLVKRGAIKIFAEGETRSNLLLIAKCHLESTIIYQSMLILLFMSFHNGLSNAR